MCNKTQSDFLYRNYDRKEQNMTNEEVRARFTAYIKMEPVNYRKVGGLIGLDENQRKYLISRFVKGRDLNANTLESLSEFLTVRGY